MEELKGVLPFKEEKMCNGKYILSKDIYMIALGNTPLSNSCAVVPVSVLLRYVSVPAFTSMYAFEDAASSYILKITFNFTNAEEIESLRYVKFEKGYTMEKEEMEELKGVLPFKEEKMCNGKYILMTCTLLRRALPLSAFRLM